MPLQLTFVTSAKRQIDLPDSPGEIAFVGRSNVGKSSLINALANRRQLAKVSNTPGRTQLINLFVLPNGATVVDLPGYGYAAVPGREQATWQAMIEGYLLEREPLALVFVLVDGEIGPTKLDLQMLGLAAGQRGAVSDRGDQARQGQTVEVGRPQPTAGQGLLARRGRRDLGQRQQGNRNRPPAGPRQCDADAYEHESRKTTHCVKTTTWSSLSVCA